MKMMPVYQPPRISKTLFDSRDLGMTFHFSNLVSQVDLSKAIKISADDFVDAVSDE